MRTWEKDEKRYWDVKYTFEDDVFPPGYRVFERDRYLFKWLKNGIKGKTLIEIGCYFPFEIILLLNPSKYMYTYIGVDITKDALITAKRYIPEGDFVQCSVTSLPFKIQSFDAILSLGVIHHLPGNTSNIRTLSKYLKTSGSFALTEAVERKTLSFLGNLKPESSSPREGRLDPKKLTQACSESGKIVVFHKNNSVVLGLFSTLIDLFPILQESRRYLRFITSIDQLTIKTLGRLSSLFNAGAYFIIFKKV